ncbi:hypothetical protein [Olsenella sp. DNF00959]|uniref:hypothetical protein n=1 Tax=Olsenella TaxID=133925 RepID=UPI00078283B5|nr:hypothetical protein [Olsenella sp. DNF00959]KXB61742.1 hypothetical protein HMPREF1868_01811 [Olsenella sp. DNF00959]
MGGNRFQRNGEAERSAHGRAGSPSRWPLGGRLGRFVGMSAPEASRTEPQGVDLRGLSRLQLLQLLEDAMEENERLRGQLDEAQRRVRECSVTAADSESLAEASLRLAGMFEDAQRAIDIYKRSIGMPLSGEGATGGVEPRSGEAGTEVRR